MGAESVKVATPDNPGTPDANYYLGLDSYSPNAQPNMSPAGDGGTDPNHSVTIIQPGAGNIAESLPSQPEAMVDGRVSRLAQFALKVEGIQAGPQAEESATRTSQLFERGTQRLNQARDNFVNRMKSLHESATDAGRNVVRIGRAATKVAIPLAIGATGAATEAIGRGVRKGADSAAHQVSVIPDRISSRISEAKAEGQKAAMGVAGFRENITKKRVERVLNKTRQGSKADPSGVQAVEAGTKVRRLARHTSERDDHTQAIRSAVTEGKYGRVISETVKAKVSSARANRASRSFNRSVEKLKGRAYVEARREASTDRHALAMDNHNLDAAAKRLRVNVKTTRSFSARANKINQMGRVREADYRDLRDRRIASEAAMRREREIDEERKRYRETVRY